MYQYQLWVKEDECYWEMEGFFSSHKKAKDYVGSRYYCTNSNAITPEDRPWMEWKIVQVKVASQGEDE